MRITEKLLLFITIQASVFTSFSCANKQSQLLFSTKNAKSFMIGNEIPEQAYRIQAQDLLQIRNLQNRKYIVHEPLMVKTQTSGSEGQTYEVEADGTVGLPILGQVKVAGLTRHEAAKHIEVLYRKELKDPIIELKIMNLKVTVLGEVKQQGNYNLIKDYTNLLEVIAAAGGLTDKSNSKNIKILRRNRQVQQVIMFDLGNIETLSDPRIILRNNDIIYVAQNRKTVRSEKLQSIAAILQPVISLLNTALIIHTLTRP